MAGSTDRAKGRHRAAQLDDNKSAEQRHWDEDTYIDSLMASAALRSPLRRTRPNRQVHDRRPHDLSSRDTATYPNTAGSTSRPIQYEQESQQKQAQSTPQPTAPTQAPVQDNLLPSLQGTRPPPRVTETGSQDGSQQTTSGRQPHATGPSQDQEKPSLDESVDSWPDINYAVVYGSFNEGTWVYFRSRAERNDFYYDQKFLRQELGHPDCLITCCAGCKDLDRLKAYERAFDIGKPKQQPSGRAEAFSVSSHQAEFAAPLQLPRPQALQEPPPPDDQGVGTVPGTQGQGSVTKTGLSSKRKHANSQTVTDHKQQHSVMPATPPRNSYDAAYPPLEEDSSPAHTGKRQKTLDSSTQGQKRPSAPDSGLNPAPTAAQAVAASDTGSRPQPSRPPPASGDAARTSASIRRTRRGGRALQQSGTIDSASSARNDAIKSSRHKGLEQTHNEAVRGVRPGGSVEQGKKSSVQPRMFEGHDSDSDADLQIQSPSTGKFRPV